MAIVSFIRLSDSVFFHVRNITVHFLSQDGLYLFTACAVGEIFKLALGREDRRSIETEREIIEYII